MLLQIHVCGDASALPLMQRLCRDMGEPLEVGHTSTHGDTQSHISDLSMKQAILCTLLTGLPRQEFIYPTLMYTAEPVC